ncbi:MAG: hypothetical protein ACP5UI_01090 [Thermoprotei archaeon]|nr:hypothetical protein [TACK group archaeon]
MRTIRRSYPIPSPIPTLAYASAASRVAWIRSTLLPEEQLQKLQDANLQGIRDALARSRCGKDVLLMIDEGILPYEAAVRCLRKLEQLVANLMPASGKRYLNSFSAAWMLEELKARIVEETKGQGISDDAIRVAASLDAKMATALRDAKVAQVRETSELLLQLDKIYFEDLLEAADGLEREQRAQLSGWLSPTLGWYNLKAEILAKKYGWQEVPRLDVDGTFKGTSGLLSLDPDEALRSGQKTYEEEIYGWAKAQAHQDQFGVAPAQAALMLKQRELFILAELLTAERYGVRLAQRRACQKKFTCSS